MGIECTTNGTIKLRGRSVEIIVKDPQIKPAIGKQLLTEAYKDDKVDLAVGPTSSAIAMAKYQRISRLEFCNDFPRNALGKVLKREVRTPYLERNTKI